MTLQELTGHESGIILYGGSSIAVCNWSGCDDDQIPMLSPFGGAMLNWPAGDGAFEDAEEEETSDIRAFLPGSMWLETNEDGDDLYGTDMDILYDENGDIPRLFDDPTITDEDLCGVVYTLKDGRKIIAPDNWN